MRREPPRSPGAPGALGLCTVSGPLRTIDGPSQGCKLYELLTILRRAPNNGCDWIGGDFAEPGEVIFNTGFSAGGRRRAGGGGGASVQRKDEPPKLFDRLK